MKILMKTCLLLFMVIGFGTTTFAQANASATANTTATIVTPLSISNSIALEFGNVAVGSTAGAVIMTPAGARSTTGGVTLPTTAGTVTAASFTVAGQANYGYSITLPTSVSLDDNNSHTMLVNTFTSNPAAGANGVLSAGGTEVLTVGATLNVGASQVAGTYESDTDFEVTVVYN